MLNVQKTVSSVTVAAPTPKGILKASSGQRLLQTTVTPKGEKIVGPLPMQSAPAKTVRFDSAKPEAEADPTKSGVHDVMNRLRQGTPLVSTEVGQLSCKDQFARLVTADNLQFVMQSQVDSNVLLLGFRNHVGRSTLGEVRQDCSVTPTFTSPELDKQSHIGFFPAEGDMKLLQQRLQTDLDNGKAPTSRDFYEQLARFGGKTDYREGYVAVIVVSDLDGNLERVSVPREDLQLQIAPKDIFEKQKALADDHYLAYMGR